MLVIFLSRICMLESIKIFHKSRNVTELKRSSSRTTFTVRIISVMLCMGASVACTTGGSSEPDPNAFLGQMYEDGQEGVGYLSTARGILKDVPYQTYERSDGQTLALYQGDILLGAHEHFLQPDRGIASAILPPDMLWPYGRIHYVFDPDSFDFSKPTDTALKERIENMMKRYEDGTVVKFIPHLPTVYGDQAYVLIKKFEQELGGPSCYSQFGHVSPAQELVLDPSCTNSDIMHELGHTLGLLHEHTRADRGSYGVEILYNNLAVSRVTGEVPESIRNQFYPHDTSHIIFSEQSPLFGIDVGPYDYDSVMHWPANAYARKDYFSIFTPNYTGQQSAIGRRQYLSYNDMQTLNWMYTKVNYATINLYEVNEAGKYKDYALALTNELYAFFWHRVGNGPVFIAQTDSESLNHAEKVNILVKDDATCFDVAYALNPSWDEGWAWINRGYQMQQDIDRKFISLFFASRTPDSINNVPVYSYYSADRCDTTYSTRPNFNSEPWMASYVRDNAPVFYVHATVPNPEPMQAPYGIPTPDKPKGLCLPEYGCFPQEN